MFSQLSQGALFAVLCLLLSAIPKGTSFSHPKKNVGSKIWRSSDRLRTELFVSANSSQKQHGAQKRRKAESLERGHHPLMSLNLNLDSLAQGGAANRAQELLQRIEALYQEGYYAVSPDVVSYNSVLHAWAKKNSPEKALELLRSLEVRQSDPRTDSESNIQANVISYNTVIHAFAQNGLYREAEEILRHMQNSGNGIVPDTITYNSVLYAYAKSPEIDAPSKAEALLREMMTDENEAQVDSTSFNTVLHAWAKSKQGRAPHRAQELLEHMERLSSAGNDKVKPDVYSYSIVIQAFVSQLRHRRWKHDQRSRGKQFDKGNSTTKTNADNTNAARTAKTLLRKMEQQQLQPDQVAYTSVISALVWSGKPQEAHDLLFDLLISYEDKQEIVGSSSAAKSMLVKPDTIAFSAVMDGWVKNAHNFPEAAERVLELLEVMKRWQANGHDDMAPNGQTYTSVISALAKSRKWDACLASKDLLNEIPGGATVIHYNAVLDAFAKSPRADKARHAKALLDKMTMDTGEAPVVSPDIISYNTVLSACAGTFGSSDLKQETLATAMTIFMHICQSEELEPSPYTFAVMMKALRKLVPDEANRCNFVGKVLQLCCKSGMLNPGVWHQVQKAIPHNEDTRKLWVQLVGEDVYHPGIQLSDLPKEWKCNSRRY